MEYLRDKEVAKRLSWPLGRIKRLLFYRQQNGLAAATFKLGKSVLIDYEAFLQWIESHREASQTKRVNQ